MIFVSSIYILVDFLKIIQIKDKMEEPRKMTSKIIESNSVISISTPKKKSWILIIFLSLIILQFTNGLIQSLFFAKELPIMGRIIILTLSFTIVYFALKGLLWQIKGVRNISIGDGELKLNKLSPLWSNTKTYRLSDIKSIDVKDESVAEGPFALLHLLKVTSKN